ncbi:MAG: hypothetical protein A2Z31_10465 [candidate division NC10 bacterium RBG_16_65_8]|nr:MAG: hypothetical protein A2Z31_10465 [candidate division NC10 bacterium RBG_16_65_8]
MPVVVREVWMKVHAALDQLIELEERVGHLYIQFYKRFSELPGVAELWWEMALEEHGHAGILKMVKALTDPAAHAGDLRPRLRPLQTLIRLCEREAQRVAGLREALAIAVRLERSELDRLGRETMRGIARNLPVVPRSAFAPHEAHLDRLTRTVRKFGGEEVLREAWALSPEARDRRPAVAPDRRPSAGPRSSPQARRRKTAASR